MRISTDGNARMPARRGRLPPTPRYMLAMKCLASRSAVGTEDRGDAADIAFLIRYLGLTSPEQAVAMLRPAPEVVRGGAARGAVTAQAGYFFLISQLKPSTGSLPTIGSPMESEPAMRAMGRFLPPFTW
jgi:hypothetical protein